MPLDPPDIRLEPIEDLSPPDPGGFLRLVRRRYRAHYPDGSVSEPFVYDEVDRAAIDAVVIAAHFSDGGERHVWLRSAVRPPIVMREPENRALWELPAGLIEPGEAPLAAAARELHEELGFEVPEERLEALGPSTFPAPGIVAERHHYFQVRVDPAARREPPNDGSPLEHLGKVVSVPIDDALAMCRRGEIEDAKTELALRRLMEEA